MRKLIAAVLLLSNSALLTAQKTMKVPATYKPTKSEMYHKGWIDFNKNGVMDVYEDPAATVDARVEDLLKQMTLDEKTCQMVTLYGYKRVLKDALPTPEWKQMLWKDGIGAIDEHLNGFQQWGLPPSDNENVWPASRHAWALNEVQRFFVEETRLGIPVDFTNEGIRGVESYKATNFPTQLGLGHTWNRALIHKVGLITGREARMLGYTNVYAPILDVGRDQRWGRYEEVYGESPYLVAELGIEMVRGLQQHVAATGKHFAAYSNNKGAREGMARVDPQTSPHEVENIHIYPFRRVIKEAGLLGVMSSYNDYDGIPIQGSYYWLTTRLRDEMGFRGYVVSDSDAVEYLYTKHGTAKDMKEAVRQSVEAGLNVRCTFRSPDSFVLPLRELVKEGGLDEETVNDRVRDILRVKFLIGLFDAPYQTDLAGADKEVEKEENEAVALQASRESVVLLKNDGTLPLKDGTKVYAEAFGKSAEAGEAATKALREMLGNVTLVDTPDEAQVALLMVSPQSGAYFNATPGYLELDICEDKTVCNVDESGKPTTETHKETTLVGANRLAGIAAAVHAHGGKVVSNINCPLAWEVGNVEKISDALTVGFDTYPSATLDLMFGRFAPVCKLPLTLPKGD